MKLILDNAEFRSYMIPFAGTCVILIKHKDTGDIFLQGDASIDSNVVTMFQRSPEYEMLKLTLNI